MTQPPPNPALITETRPHRHRGRTFYHLRTDPTSPAPVLVAAPGSPAAQVAPPFWAVWKDETSPRGRVTRIITGVKAL